MAQSSDLHGNAPDTSAVALVVIDMINDLEFPGGDVLLAPALAAADQIAALQARARASRIPVVYANDNFGRWRSNFRDVVDHVLHDGVRGQPLAERLEPHEDDYFVLKPKHSAFFATTMETLLAHLGCRRLILTGVAVDACVQFTAQDAYLRDYELFVPSDCVASFSEAATEASLAYMARVMDADTRPSTALDLDALRQPQRTR